MDVVFFANNGLNGLISTDTLLRFFTGSPNEPYLT